MASYLKMSGRQTIPIFSALLFTGFFQPASPVYGQDKALPCVLTDGKCGVVPGFANSDSDIEAVTVIGRQENLLGIATSANQGSVSANDLALRPMLRPGEVVENIPGVIVTQHSGSGKANQYFLRGFNLDHGTDLAISIDGMPINMPSHAHGQGYADLNFVIPELISRVDYKKGPYYADVGDFGAAGAFNLRYYDALPAGLMKVDAGEVGYQRAVLVDSTSVQQGALIYGLEAEHNDGPWAHGDDERKFSGVLRYAQGDARDGFSITTMAYYNKFYSTDQVPDRAIASVTISRFGSFDNSDGGKTARFSLSGNWHQTDGNGFTDISLYAFHYNLDLFSDFTYFLDDPRHGDQFEQQDSRFTMGGQARQSWEGELFALPMENIVGFELRDDEIHNGLFHTQRRERLSTDRLDVISETSGAPYLENQLHWTSWLRTITGVRADFYRFDTRNITGGDSGERRAALISPKVAIVMGPWADTEIYLNGGYGFHSNDARGVTSTIDPARPLARAKGAELGIRTSIIPGLQTSLTAFDLDIASELVYSGDSGTTEPNGPTRRTGIEFSNFYTPVNWLSLDFDYAISRARFTDYEPEGSYIPEALEATLDGGVAIHDLEGWASPISAGLRLRYFGPRPLTQDNSVRSKATTLLYADLGYRLSQRLTVQISIFNLLDTKASDIDYFYTSRLAGERADGVADIHTHPSEPREFRFSIVGRL